MVVALGAWLMLRDAPGADRALAVLADDDRFTTARRGAEALIEVGDILQVAGSACADGRDASDCESLLEASAFARVAAVRLAGCTLPYLHDTRRDMIAYLGRLQAGDEPVEPPKLPAC